MPAHITHELFADLAFSRAFGVEMRARIDTNRRFWVFGSQGPDFFLHNQRTKPSGLIYGKLLHTSGYGSFTSNLLEVARKSGAGVDSELGGYILGFASHAVLDRFAHPFINYYSGWIDPAKPETIRYHNCHAFFERIIDILLLKILAEKSIAEYDFYERVECGREIPTPILDAMIFAIEATYPEYVGHDAISLRVENAYRDTIGFYEYTNPTNSDNYRHAAERDGGGGNPARRFLALFQPQILPLLDYLNAKHETWNHPGDPEETHTESFVDLVEMAVEAAIAPLRVVGAALEGEGSLGDVAETIGDENLSDGRKRKAKRRIDHINPLPLDGVLASIYEAIRTGELAS